MNEKYLSTFFFIIYLSLLIFLGVGYTKYVLRIGEAFDKQQLAKYGIEQNDKH